MLNEISTAIYEKTAKHKITHVSITHDKTRIFVDMDVELIGLGLQKTCSHIWIIGDSKNILENKWILVRTICFNRKQMRDDRITLSDKTKKEIYDFMVKEFDKVDKKRFDL
jgi:hypothetical protein